MTHPSSQEPSPHLDPEALDNLRRQMPDQPDILTRIVQIFLSASPDLLTSLRTAVHAGDPEAVCQAAHRMKSSNGQIGATKLAAMCHELEILGSLGQLLDVDQLLADLEEEYRCVEAELRLLLDQNLDQAKK